LTWVQTPLFCGQPLSAGVFVLNFGCTRGDRTSWLNVAIQFPPKDVNTHL